MSSSSSDIAIPAAAAGVLVLVVGPSGAGKDTLMEAARDELGTDPRYRFARRLITRPAMAGAEDHESCDEVGFRAIEANGGLALSWQAHGLSYGIPAAELSGIGAGAVVIVNVSRRAIVAAERLVERVVVLNITAPVAVLARRLAARGRETEADIAARLKREAPLTAERAEVVTILNDRSVAEACAELLAVLRGLGR
ncbi:phosphonate metabolism protein/1,5-bisphosphokinase (PRPP-forming) PhnN [Bosea sp. ANAM02]|uniref:phosphonate metabolism protein/1,5-bisphosphokinase (PRPP-forming) PhnN n=1 Tax=Bosea sp. ANAM02 TaxID=2020412 RepID=UPI00140EBB1B|nr:phosphonate metabolism protein/1,5-bisphosphokinase (PRPP-forming) PhnN [Bosea sp. ANAM02]BCB17952.1 ribose 1,5-bisphosphate phosphokinase PhnN [Bosea sp. ANAM02]